MVEDGNIYVNEDGGGQDVWQLDPSTGQAIRIADGLGTETAGIKDISSLVGFEAGSIFLTNSYNGNIGNGNNGSLYMLVSPTATRLSSVLHGDMNLDGSVDFRDISRFISVLANGRFQAEADINDSGAVDFLDISLFIMILSGS